MHAVNDESAMCARIAKTILLIKHLFFFHFDAVIYSLRRIQMIIKTSLPDCWLYVSLAETRIRCLAAISDSRLVITNWPITGGSQYVT